MAEMEEVATGFWAVGYDERGINFAITLKSGVVAPFYPLTPRTAREIARALNTAADRSEALDR